MNTETKIKALKEFLTENEGELTDEITEDYENNFSTEYGDYMVLDDDEADQAWEDSLDNYLEECIYPDLEGSLANYFDDEKWKRDAKFDGRGHSLNSYDGSEEEIKTDEGYAYIYRTN